MEFRLNDGQLELQRTIGRFCSTHFAFDDIASREGSAVDRSLWRSLADLGVFGLLLPEDAGGVGLGPVEAAIVYEQLGTHLASGPLVWSLLAASLIDGAARGTTVATGVEARFVTDGAADVCHVVDADIVLVVHEDVVVAHRLDDLPAPEPRHSLDPLGTVARVTGLTGGDVVGDAAAVDALRLTGTLLTAAMLTGIGARSLDVARDYALEREQFGAPIGSFQAVKHMLADMYVRTASARSAAYAAAAASDDPGAGEPARSVDVAKLLAADSAIENASDAIQVLGGMGFTWDMPPNYLLKRAWTLESEFGSMNDLERSLGLLVGSAS